MFCRGCQFDLSGLREDRCPECGRLFDPADPTSFEKRRSSSHAIRGIGIALVIGTAMSLGFWASLMSDFGYSRHAAFLTIVGIGLVGGVGSAAAAAWNGRWLGRIPLLLVGVIGVWLGLFFGSDHSYRVWQSMPNPPDEAFADTAPIGALLLGWLPGSVIVGAAFGVTAMVLAWRRRRRRPTTSEI